MSCVPFKSADGSVCGWVTIADVYEFEGFLFEWHSYLGPVPLNKRTKEPRTRVPKGFWSMIDRWTELSDEEREGFRV